MIRASEPAREILQNTNICKIHGFVGLSPWHERRPKLRWRRECYWDPTFSS